MQKIDKFIPSEALLNQLSGGFIWKDLTLRYCAANLKLAKNFGFASIEAMVGLTSYDIRCPAVDYAEYFLKNDQEVIETKKNIKTLDIHRFADNNLKLFFGERTPLIDQNEGLLGVLYQASEINQKTLLEFTMKLGRLNEKFELKKYSKQGYRFLIKESIFNLTEREFEILFYIIRGKTAKEIARFIGISFRTVEYHFNLIKYKLDCKTKKDIIDKAITHGLINVIPASTFTDSISYKSLY